MHEDFFRRLKKAAEDGHIEIVGMGEAGMPPDLQRILGNFPTTPSGGKHPGHGPGCNGDDCKAVTIGDMNEDEILLFKSVAEADKEIERLKLRLKSALNRRDHLSAEMVLKVSERFGLEPQDILGNTDNWKVVVPKIVAKEANLPYEEA